MIPQSHSQWFLCTLYTVQWHSFGGFYVSFVHSTEFSARPNWDPSQPQESVSPPPLVRGGGGGHTRLRVRGSLYGVDVTV
jgi:hypothetical protein